MSLFEESSHAALYHRHGQRHPVTTWYRAPPQSPANPVPTRVGPHVGASRAAGPGYGALSLASVASIRFFCVASFTSACALVYAAIAPGLSPLPASASPRLSCAFHEAGW